MSMNEMDKWREEALERMRKCKEETEELKKIYLNKQLPSNKYNVSYKSNFIMESRDALVPIIGFTRLTSEFVDSLVETFKGKKVLEVMCGLGALSYYLKERGVDIIASTDLCIGKYATPHDYDTNAWVDIERIDAVEAIKKYGSEVDYVIANWIPYNDSIGYEVLKKLYEVNPNAILMSVGEYGGCTGEDLFDSAGISVSDDDNLDSSIKELHNKVYEAYPEAELLNDFVRFVRYDASFDINTYTDKWEL